MQGLSLLALFMVGAPSLVLASGYNWGPTLLGLLGLGLWLTRRAQPLPAEARTLLAAFLVFGVGQSLLAAWHGQAARHVAGWLHFLSAVPMLVAVLTFRPPAGLWFMGAALGGLLSGAWAGWQKWVLGLDRALGHTYVIQFGDIGLLLGLMAVLGLLYFHDAPRHRGRSLLLLAGAAGGLLTSLLSGSRGGWIGLPLVAWLLWRTFRPVLAPELRRRVLLLTLLLVSAVVLVPQTGVQSRIGQAYDELHRLAQGDNSGGSVVPRLYMWRMALQLTPERPLLGWGQDGFEAERERQQQAGETKLRLKTSHVHNEMLDTLVKHGLVGSLLLLLLYAVPIGVFARGMNAEDHALRALAVAGLLVPLLFIDFGLSQTMFGRNSGRVVYFAWIPILHALYLIRHDQVRSLASAMPGYGRQSEVMS